MLLCILFFFSSRRRHTRWTGDWSSDVCSSDLLMMSFDGLLDSGHKLESHRNAGEAAESYLHPPRRSKFGCLAQRKRSSRSEERRVGKECRSWWSPYD